MSVEGDIHAALIAHASTIIGYTMVWPKKNAAQPDSEHIRVSHLPNEHRGADLSGQTMERKGFLYVTLVSAAGDDEEEVVTRRKAGEIASFFPRAGVLTHGEIKVKITGHSIGPGRREGGRWETPIRISYWSMS